MVISGPSWVDGGMSVETFVGGWTDAWPLGFSATGPFDAPAGTVSTDETAFGGADTTAALLAMTGAVTAGVVTVSVVAAGVVADLVMAATAPTTDTAGAALSACASPARLDLNKRLHSPDFERAILLQTFPQSAAIRPNATERHVTTFIERCKNRHA
jgi:hypothetical protein